MVKDYRSTENIWDIILIVINCRKFHVESNFRELCLGKVGNNSGIPCEGVKVCIGLGSRTFGG